MSAFLAGEQPVETVLPANRESVRLRVEVPFADMATLGESTGWMSAPAAGPERRSSLWPDAEQRILALVGELRSTIVFANSRRFAGWLAARLNELVAEPAEAGQLTKFPAEAIGEPGIAARRPVGGGLRAPRIDLPQAGKQASRQAGKQAGNTVNRRQP
ncbi:hypothetical protein [Streptomyces sp. NPDC001165]|uniref:hypothetical protein n=1 Tax=Streptomyces sp. NPDC001165 TaxID=3364546 RepID=UPI00367627CE